jgi:hypothetical protein
LPGFLATAPIKFNIWLSVPILATPCSKWSGSIFYQANRSTPNLKPSVEYLGYIVDGLESHPDANSEYCKALAATATGESDRLTMSYLWEQPENRSPWLRHTIGLYQKFVLVVFLNILYKRSLTVYFIRH